MRELLACPLQTLTYLNKEVRLFFQGDNSIWSFPSPEGPAIEKIQSRSKISIPARIFQSRSKFSISIENFNPRVSIYGALVVYTEGVDRKFQSTIVRSKFSIPKAAIEFQSPGPLGLFLPLATTAYGGPEGYFFCLAIITFGAIQFLVPKMLSALRKDGQEESSLLNLRRLRS